MKKIQKRVVAVKVESLISSRTMTGIEYEVLHVQDPILYVIRKQHRISQSQGREKELFFLHGVTNEFQKSLLNHLAQYTYCHNFTVF